MELILGSGTNLHDDELRRRKIFMNENLMCFMAVIMTA